MKNVRRVLGRLGVGVIFVGTGIVVGPRSAVAVILPGVGGGFPAVGLENGLSAVRFRGSGLVSSTSIDPEFPFDGDSYSLTSTLFSSDYHDSVSESLSAAASSGEQTVLSQATGTAGFGVLRGEATASNTKGGYATATASLVVDFMDMFQVKLAGEPGGVPTDGRLVNFDLDWAVEGSVSAVTGYGSAYAVAELWIFPFGQLPFAGSPIIGTSYRRSVWLVGEAPADQAIGDLSELVAGGRYWMFGRMELFASRLTDTAVETDIAGVSTADFSHTVRLSITPRADSPGASIETESGFNYQFGSELPGDADGDGDVDLDDQGIWAANFTGSLGAGSGSASFGQGDFDGDQDVDLDDQGIWAANFTGSLAPSALGVPEPGGVGVVGVGVVGLVGRRRR